MQAIVLLKKYSTHYKDKILYVTKNFLEKISLIDYNLIAGKTEMPREFARQKLLEGGLAPRILVNYYGSTSAAMHRECLGGCFAKCQEDYRHKDCNPNDNLSHQLHPLSGGFLLDLNRLCRVASSTKIINHATEFFKRFSYFKACKKFLRRL